MCSGCISNMTEGADPGFSWWPPQNQNGLPPKLLNWLIQVVQRLPFYSSFIIFRCSSLELFSVSFGLVSLDCCCLSVRPAWPTAVCSNYILGEGWVSVTHPSTLSVWTRLDSAQWGFTYIWFSNCGPGPHRSPCRVSRQSSRKRVEVSFHLQYITLEDGIGIWWYRKDWFDKSHPSLSSYWITLSHSNKGTTRETIKLQYLIKMFPKSWVSLHRSRDKNQSLIHIYISVFLIHQLSIPKNASILDDSAPHNWQCQCRKYCSVSFMLCTFPNLHLKCFLLPNHNHSATILTHFPCTDMSKDYLHIISQMLALDIKTLTVMCLFFLHCPTLTSLFRR